MTEPRRDAFSIRDLFGPPGPPTIIDEALRRIGESLRANGPLEVTSSYRCPPFDESCYYRDGGL